MCFIHLYVVGILYSFVVKCRRVKRKNIGQCLINFFGLCWTPEASLSEPRQHSKTYRTADHDISQLTFTRLAKACNAASEDRPQSSSENSAPAAQPEFSNSLRVRQAGELFLFVFFYLLTVFHEIA